MTDTTERFLKILKDYLGADNPDMNASIVDDLGADSLDAVELVMAVEDEFEIEVRDEDAESILTVGDAIRYIDCCRASEREDMR